jgi:hypothetical protein
MSCNFPLYFFCSKNLDFLIFFLLADLYLIKQIFQDLSIIKRTCFLFQSCGVP